MDLFEGKVAAPQMKHSQKKCYSCKEWSAWDGSEDAVCSLCGKAMDPVLLQEKQQFEKNESKLGFQLDFIKIKDDDNAVVSLLKGIGIGAQYIFAAIVSAIIWIVTATAG